MDNIIKIRENESNEFVENSETLDSVLQVNNNGDTTTTNNNNNYNEMCVFCNDPLESAKSVIQTQKGSATINKLRNSLEMNIKLKVGQKVHLHCRTKHYNDGQKKQGSVPSSTTNGNWSNFATNRSNSATNANELNFATNGSNSATNGNGLSYATNGSTSTTNGNGLNFATNGSNSATNDNGLGCATNGSNSTTNGNGLNSATNGSNSATDELLNETGKINICFFCGHPARASHKAKKGKDICKVNTKTFQETIEKRIKERQDKWGQEVKERIGTRNLYSLKAPYHHKCSVKFRQEVTDSSVGRPQNEDRQSAFLKVVDFMNDNEGDAFTINDLLDVMKRECNGDYEEYCAKFLKTKLMEHFGENICFIQSKGKPDYIIFRHSANSIISEFYKKQKSDSAAEKQMFLDTAAKLVLSDITSMNYNKEEYPTSDQISKIEYHENFVPDSLLSVLNGIIKSKNSKLKIVSIAQAIVQAACPRRAIAPLQIALSVLIHHLTGSKFIIRLLYLIGFCASYDETQRFERCAAAAEDDEPLDHQQVSPKQVVKYVGDNIDHDTRTIDGKNTFHAMGMIAAHTPWKIRKHTIKRTNPTMEDIRSIKSAEIYQYLGELDEKKIIYGDISSLSGMNIMKRLDIMVNVTWRSNKERPLWSGIMQTINKGIHPGKSSVVILPIIDLNPSDPDCVYSTLKFFAKEAEKNNVTPVAAFDQPLWWKAQLIIQNEPKESPLKEFVLLLGGFHTQMSFLGTIGHLCEGLGLEEILGKIYATNSVPYLMNGKAYSRAIRGYFMIDLALNKLLMEELTPCKSSKLEWEGALSKANSLFDDLMAGKITLEEVETNTVSKSIQEEIYTFKEVLSSKSRTAKLWLQFMQMVDILKSYIRGERIGDWLLHLGSLYKKLPYFAAAGHNPYTKSSYVYLEQMIQLESTHPNVYAQFSDGHFVVRQSDRYWAGIPCDLTIEQKLMRNLKSQIGLTRGRGIGENQRLVWINSMPECVDIRNAMEDLTGLHYETSEQHKDVGASRQRRDLKDLQIILEYLKERNPFKLDEGINLRNICNGIEAKKAVNVDEANRIGEKIISSMKNQNAADYTFKKVNQAITMHSKNTIMIDGDPVTIDPQLLFQRLILLSGKMDEEQLRDVFKYELSQRPSALFDEHGFMRYTDNTSLDNALMKTVGTAESIENINVDRHVICGNFLINTVAWKKAKTYDEILSDYVTYVRQYKNPVIVFESYTSEASIRDEFQLRKNNGVAGIKISFTGNMLCSTKKEIFLINNLNKQRFTDMLSEKLIENGWTVLKASNNLNLLITKTVIRYAASNDIIVISDDSELLYVLCSHYNDYLQKIILKSDKKHLWDIGKIQSVIGEQMMYYLAFVNAFGGCKTTSVSFGIGKGTSLKKLLNVKEFQNVAMIFSDPKSTVAQVTEAGNKAIVMLYNGKKHQTLNDLRYTRFGDKVKTAKSCIKVQSLPPTEAATHYHHLRVYLQTQIWLGNESLDPLQYGWKKVNQKFVPQTTDLEVAPIELLSKIRCKCKGDCSTKKCNCQKNQMKCSVACTECRGSYCLNSSECVHEGDDEDDGEI